jgi:two-component system sensor histidine kinase DegS
MALDKFDPNLTDALDGFQAEIHEELQNSKKTFKEISLMLDQSQAGLNKLIQRNQVISSQFQQILLQSGNALSEEIRSSLSNSMESQQRTIVMRGQLEKVQNEQVQLKKYIGFLEKAENYFKVNPQASSKGRAGQAVASLEMMINAQESERQRLSKQMHDGPAQALSNFIVQTEIAARLLELDPLKAKVELGNLKTAAMATFQKVRSYISELRPMMLDDLGLVPTFRRYLEGLKEQYNVDVVFNITGGERRLESFMEVIIFRAAQELVENSIQFNLENPGKIQINTQLNIENDLVKLTVSDNGVGFDPETILKTSGLGIKIIRERVEMLGGKMNIDSSVGHGSSISIQVPVILAQPTN